MMDFNFTWSNVVEAEGIGISITGMFVVFTGLTLISLNIIILPKFLAWLDNLSKPRPAPVPVTVAPAQASDADPDLAAAIMAVIAAEMEQTERDPPEKITIERSPRATQWSMAGRMRNVSHGARTR